jgi:hypothetical protein
MARRNVNETIAVEFASEADVSVGTAPDEKSTLSVACHRHALAIRAPKTGGGAQHDEALPVGDDRVGSAGGPQVAELDAPAKAVRSAWQERLTRASGDFPSHRLPLKLAKLRQAVGVVPPHPEPAEGIAALLERAPHFHPEPVRSEGVGTHPIEPDRPRMADLFVQRERLSANEQSMTDGRPARTVRGRPDQVGRPLTVGRI